MMIFFILLKMNKLVQNVFMHFGQVYSEILYYNLIFITTFFIFIGLSKIQPGL